MQQANIRMEWINVQKEEYPNLKKQLQKAANLALQYVSSAVQIVEHDIMLPVGDSRQIDQLPMGGKTIHGRKDTLIGTFFGQRAVDWFASGSLKYQDYQKNQFRYQRVLQTLRLVQMQLATGQTTFVMESNSLKKVGFNAMSYRDWDTGRIFVEPGMLLEPLDIGKRKTVTINGKTGTVTGKVGSTLWGTIVHELCHIVDQDISDQKLPSQKNDPNAKYVYDLKSVKKLAKEDPELAAKSAQNYSSYLELGVKEGLFLFALEKSMTTGWNGRDLMKAGETATTNQRFTYYKNIKKTNKATDLKKHRASVLKVVDANSLWLPENQKSKWFDVPAGDDHSLFVLKFYVPKFLLKLNHRKIIKGRWATDNSGIMTLYDPRDKTEVEVTTIGQADPTDRKNFNTWHDFYVDNVSVIEPGDYELRFYVKNSGDIGGFRAEIKRYATV